MTRWATRIVDGEGRQALEAARTHAPVIMVATPRDALQCRPLDQWQTIEGDRDLAAFDQVPLTGSDGHRIEAMYVRGHGRTPLVSDMFMAADAPLLAFVETADEQRFRLLVEEGDVVGMVTLSDLQRLAVYSLLFSLLIAVEVLLAEWIRGACRGRPDAWIQCLHSKQWKTIERHWKEAVAANLAIDPLSCASVSHKIDAARGLGLFAAEPEREAHLASLKRLRDHVCHAIEVAPTAERALQIPSMARVAQELAEWLVDKTDGKRE